MSRNGSGTYSLPAGNPVVTGTTISSTWANNTLSDIATALTQSIASDGQTTPTANLPMGTYKHTGVGVATATTDYARADQVQNSSIQWLTSVTGTDTITASASITPAAYAAGQTFRFVSAGANTGAVTLNVSSLGAKSVTKRGSTALAAGDIPSGATVVVTYDGTQFQYVGCYDADTAKTDVGQNWTASQRSEATTDNDLSFDLATANNFKCAPTAGGTITFTNIASQTGQSGFILLVNGSNYSIAAHANTKVGSSALATISATGTYLLSYFNDGTNVYVVNSGALS